MDMEDVGQDGSGNLHRILETKLFKVAALAITSDSLGNGGNPGCFGGSSPLILAVSISTCH